MQRHEVEFVIEEVKKIHAEHGWEKAMVLLGCSKAHLFAVLRGGQTPGRAMLHALDLKAVTVYEAINP